MQFLEFRAVDSIKKSTTLKNDFMMLILLSQDLIVLEGHYHKKYAQRNSPRSMSSYFKTLKVSCMYIQHL